VIPGLRDTLLRFLPHAHTTGLLRLGEPGRDSPVLLTCNYTLTVRRLRAALRGRDAWLLVVDSRGFNVWCAAGGGHLTHHDVISAIRTSGIADLVDHRRAVLPMLAATGVERRRIEDATGWTVTWGPARLDDLPAYLDRGNEVRTAERRVTFPGSDRMEMAAAWGFWMVALGFPIVAIAGGWPAAVATCVGALVATAALFAAIRRLPLLGGARWGTAILLLAVAAAVAAGILLPLGAIGLRSMLATGIGLVVAIGSLVSDVSGTTPHLPSSLNALATKRAAVDVLPEQCAGDALCTLVCPHAVLEMAGRSVSVVAPQRCIVCGACVVQCPRDAVRFRFPDGSVVEPETIRRTRLNLLGRRTAEED